MNAIQVSRLSKVYQISPEKKQIFVQGALKEDLIKLWEKPSRLYKGLLKLAKVNTFENNKINYLALNKVTFSIHPGEVLGIIGSNGSGKSTLLKILAGITPPTEGEAKLIGKVASLLAVGIGFHSDLSGRDNIFLSGSLLGFKKKMIEQELENIIRFSGIRKFIDTPVKYYSSGMYVRLAFAIATSECMSPDIFLIDEVLSVGDLNFQKKCLKKIQLLIKKGCSVVIVSHNMNLIEKLCNRCILLDQGQIRSTGKPKDIIAMYKNSFKV
jgi:lipopolysaccharide transport system ATP-binding protein